MADIPAPILTLADVDNPEVTWGLTVYAGHITPMERVGDGPWKPMAAMPGVLADYLSPFAAMFALWLTPRGVPSERNNPNSRVVDAIRRERHARRQQQGARPPLAADVDGEPERYYSSRELYDIGSRDAGYRELAEIGLRFGVNLRDGVKRKLGQGVQMIMNAQRVHRDSSAHLRRAPATEVEEEGWAGEPAMEAQEEADADADDWMSGFKITKENLEKLDWNQLRALGKRHELPCRNAKQLTEALLEIGAAASAAASSRPNGQFGPPI